MIKANTWPVAMVLLACSGAAVAVAAERDAELAKPYLTVNGVAQPIAWAEVIFRDLIQRGAQDSDVYQGFEL